MVALYVQSFNGQVQHYSKCQNIKKELRMLLQPPVCVVYDKVKKQTY